MNKESGKLNPITRFAAAAFKLHDLKALSAFGATSSSTLFHFPGTDDWKAAWRRLKYDVATLDYELNGGAAGRVLDKLKE
ncbi:hypothetical protein [Chitinophaga sp. RAB17]|uniref:hypothetical protein n=1 Tax=Chitinophaga sp. RAB17 TaxID=3233049 RepID=UPI003F8EE4EC